jgi:uncharacterized protein YggE
MRNTLVITGFFVALFPVTVRAQFGGGSAMYTRDGQGAKLRAQQLESQRRMVSKEELPPTPTSTFVEAAVLYNAKADHYVAVFAISQEGSTVAECNRRMTEKVAAFTKALTALGVKEQDIFADFIAQTRLYEYEVNQDIALEKPAGFEQKNNVSIHFRESGLLSKIVTAAAELEIFDLVKVDYLVDDIEGIREKMAREATRVIKRKVERHQELLGHPLRPSQIYAERTGVYFPNEMYDTYTAAEAENVRTPIDRQRYVVQEVRKSRTGYFNGLDGRDFDVVMNAVILEPVVQLTLYTKVRYESMPAN